MMNGDLDGSTMEDDAVQMISLVKGRAEDTADGDDDDDDDEASSSAIQKGHGEFGNGTASQKQVAINIFISFVGAGMLGMPYAFSLSGWLLGSVSLSLVSMANVYCMLLLVKTRKKLEAEGHTDVDGYGDIGRIVMGSKGEKLVNMCMVIAQVGFATAYIIFIAANLYSIAEINRAYVCFGCVPLLAILVQVREMKSLSPFSLVADLANLAGLSAVFLQDFEYYHHETIVAVNFSNAIYVIAVSVYSLEGVALVLPLESSCIDRAKFPSLLMKVVTGITVLMIVFGCSGYIAFASGTLAPITLNLQGEWASFVKLALCLALYLTYPIMMFPVNDVIENMFLSETSKKPSRLFRAAVVFCTALVAYSVPDFGIFLSLVGSSICTLLGFIIPCCVHWMVFKKEMTVWETMLDAALIGLGTVFGAFGTYGSIMKLFDPESDGGLE
mmetsp:Transcript_50188/g.74506  ORF Transcript_50188/g.74506 Transcript_50188/m.74506 type:complete len:442 (-) Transcript_50188:352-1677(-)